MRSLKFTKRGQRANLHQGHGAGNKQALQQAECIPAIHACYQNHCACKTEGVHVFRFVSSPPLTAEDGKDDQGRKRKEHWLYVLGKGSKMRKVPMTHEVMGALSQYLAWRELAADPFECDPETRLIAPLENEEVGDGISESWLYGLLKGTFEQAARNLSGEDRAKLKRASTHWLRHTSGSHQVRDDVPLVVVQQNFGHASLKTTGQYAQQEATIRHQAVTDFMKKRVG